MLSKNIKTNKYFIDFWGLDASGDFSVPIVLILTTRHSSENHIYPPHLLSVSPPQPPQAHHRPYRSPPQLDRCLESSRFIRVSHARSHPPIMPPSPLRTLVSSTAGASYRRCSPTSST
jgi:hypothetical protein